MRSIGPLVAAAATTSSSHGTHTHKRTSAQAHTHTHTRAHAHTQPHRHATIPPHRLLAGTAKDLGIIRPRLTAKRDVRSRLSRGVVLPCIAQVGCAWSSCGLVTYALGGELRLFKAPGDASPSLVQYGHHKSITSMAAAGGKLYSGSFDDATGTLRGCLLYTSPSP